MKLFEHILGEAVTRKQDSEPEGGFLTASTRSGKELSVRVFYPAIDYPSDCFKISLVNTPNVGESQVTGLRFKGADTSTCGYVFPITSLRTGEYLPDGRWPSIYAAAATRELVETGIAVPLVTCEALDVSELEITDLLPDNLGVLVLGCEQLDRASTSIEAVELMLMEYGYAPRSVSVVSSAVLHPAPVFETKVSLRPLAIGLIDEVVALKWLMASTSLQQTKAGRFLTLYQILECVLSRVFGKAMAHVIADKRCLADPWWVRDMVQQIQGEIWRLNFIQQHCLQSGTSSHNSFLENREACQKLLVNLGLREPNATPLAWANAIYRIRNIFVHNQAALREADDSLMENVCETLQIVCFEVMDGYNDPSSDFLKDET